MKCQNVSFRANYLTSPTLLQTPKTTTPPLQSSVHSPQIYTKKPTAKTPEEIRKDQMLVFAYLFATASFCMAAYSLVTSKGAQETSNKLLNILKGTVRNAGTHAPVSSPSPSFGNVKKYFQGEMWEDLSKAIGLDDLSLGDELKTLAQKTIKLISSPEIIKERGGKVSASTLLYGPAGTGKTTFAKAIAKSVPNSEFASIDIAKLGSEYVSVTERKLNGAIDEIFEAAKANPDKKIFVFLDEVDSIMMVDNGTGAKHSNDVLNVLKKGMTEKFDQLENIFVFAATNLELDADAGYRFGRKQLDRPMLDRFKNKIFVDTPTKEQLLGAIVKHYQNKKCTLVADEMKDISSPKLQKLAAFLEKYKISFRTLESLYQDAATSIEDDTAKLSLKDFINAIRTKATEYGIDIKEIDKLLKELT